MLMLWVITEALAAGGGAEVSPRLQDEALISRDLFITEGPVALFVVV